MRALLRLLVIAAQLAASAFPCAPHGAPDLAPELARAYAAGALHAHGAAPEPGASELRAPCACGCDEAPAATLAPHSVGAALLPAASAFSLPRAGHPLAAPLSLALAPARLPEPVPRLA
jgi:hypothetical protein